PALCVRLRDVPVIAVLLDQDGARCAAAHERSRAAARRTARTRGESARVEGAAPGISKQHRALAADDPGRCGPAEHRLMHCDGCSESRRAIKARPTRTDAAWREPLRFGRRDVLQQLAALGLAMLPIAFVDGQAAGSEQRYPFPA